MKQHILLLCVALLSYAAHSFGGVTLTVPDVNIVPGGTAYVIVNADFGTKPYTAYQFDIAYPEGISAETDQEGCPVFTKGPVYIDGKHLVSSAFSPAGLSRFQCFTTTSDAFTAQNGTLLILTVKAKASMSVGKYQATIDPVEFVQTDATPDRPGPITFNIVVSRQVVLDETSTMPPTAATGVDVNVKRTIKAGEWSTICLPFAIGANELATAFGCDVELGDFQGCEQDDDTGNVNVKFAAVTAIEANHPYIIKVASDVTEIKAVGVDIAPEEVVSIDLDKSKKNYNSFIGNYVNGTKVDDYGLYLMGGKFWYSKGNVSCKAFRGYFVFNSVDVDYDESRIMLAFTGTNGITTVEAIASGETLYNLSGRKVLTTQKGIYVKKGKKVIVK